MHAGDTAVFYYAGHGVQIGGVNYLVPVDFEAVDEIAAKDRGYSAEIVRERMEAARARLNVLILDACRNNPFNAGKRSAAGRGMAAMEPGQGTLIALATGPGMTADDSPSGKNGLFTRHLVETLRTPGLSVTQVFDKVKARVVESSEGKQRPWVLSDVIGDLYLNPGTVQAGPAPPDKPSPAEVSVVSGAQVEIAFWDSIKNSSDPGDFDAYLKEYPTGRFRLLAENRVKKLRAAETRERVAPTATPSPRPTAGTTSAQKTLPAPISGRIDKTPDEKSLYELGLVVGKQLEVYSLDNNELQQVASGMSDTVLGLRPQVVLEEWLPRIQEFAKSRSKNTSRRSVKKKNGTSLGGGPSRPPETDHEKCLYSVGVLCGRRFNNLSITQMELPFVIQGLYDFAGLPKDAASEIVSAETQEFLKVRQAKLAETEKRLHLEYIRKAAAERGAVKTSSGLVFASLKEGTGLHPKATDRVKVHYHGTLTDNTVFDSSVQRGQPATFPLNGVIPCWTEGLGMMKVGGKAKLVCPSSIAYGDAGQGPIKPGATLVFEVELLAIEPAAKPESSSALEYIRKAAAERGAVKTSSGLVFVSLKEGTGLHPKPTDRVKVHYHGTLTDNTVFDSSVQRGQPQTFPLNGVIPCWTEGVGMMKVGGKAKLVCPSSIAYGDKGQGPIKPGATLVFEVELLAIE